MDCIICQDSGSEPLQENTSCSCKYQRHSSCWIEYIHSRENVICLLCRKDLTKKLVPTAPSSVGSIPYSSQHHTIPIEQQITYQEFVEIIHSNQRLNDPLPRVTPASNTSNRKIFKLVVGLGIIIAIIVVLIVVLV